MNVDTRTVDYWLKATAQVAAAVAAVLLVYGALNPEQAAAWAALGAALAAVVVPLAARQVVGGQGAATSVPYTVPHAVHDMAQRIGRSFNIEEIDDLAYRLGINPEDINGRTRSRRAVELVGHVQRRDKTDQLVDVCRALRPEAEWPTINGE